MAADADPAIAVRQPVNARSSVKIGPGEGLAALGSNVHPLVIRLDGADAVNLNGLRPDVVLDPRLFPHYWLRFRSCFGSCFRARFRAWGRFFRARRCRTRSRKRTCRRGAVVVALNTAPAGVVDIRE